MKQSIYFLRHGQTWFNVAKRWQGWSNSQLTNAGIALAKKSGKVFAHIPFEIVYSSDLGRAMDTAYLFLEAAEKKLKVHRCPGLREVGFGYFEGLEGAAVVEQIKKQALEKGILNDSTLSKDLDEKTRINLCAKFDPYHIAEDFSTFQNRVNQTVKDIVAANPDKERLLLVSHSSAIQCILEGLDRNFHADAPVDNGAICILCHENGRFWVEGYNLFAVNNTKNE